MKVDHLGIAVPDLADALGLWTRLLGVEGSPPEEVESQMVRVSFVDVGSTHLEFLAPTQPDSPIGRFVAERGGGLHHLAFRVPNVDQTLATLAARGFQLIDRTGRPGARGRRVGFVHPKSTGHVLVEFVEGA
jgi:methylmalonyl-CoA/ethylmalonyl-CoA epimerase